MSSMDVYALWVTTTQTMCAMKVINILHADANAQGEQGFLEGLWLHDSHLEGRQTYL